MKRRLPNINFVTTHNLCTGCGICVGACPTKAIKTVIKKGRFIPEIDDALCNNDKGCHRCMDVCPGVAVDFGKLSDIYLGTPSKGDKLIGPYEECYSGHSTDEDLRYHASSGGMVTQLLIWLLETDRIDGAVVTTFDNDNPLMVKTFIASTREQLIKAKGSKYSPVTLDEVARQIKDSDKSRFVVVGLPCHIEGLRKQSLKDPVLRKKIVASFGLYCSCGRTFYLTEHVMKERHLDRHRLTYFAYRDNGCLGSMVALQTYTDDACKNELYAEPFQNYYHPLRSFFIPKRCLFCIDHYARLADMSFGDIHVAPYSYDKVGINSIVARTPLMVEWLNEAKGAGVIALDVLDAQILNRSQGMARKKYNRVGAYLRVAQMLGSKVPVYDIKMPVKKFAKNSIDYIQTRVQQFIGRNKSLWPLIKFLKSKPPKH